MAILESVPGIQVTVVSQGKTLDEYPHDGEFNDKSYKTPTERIFTSYIECVTDEEFQVKVETTSDFRHTESYTHLSFEVYSDGQPIVEIRNPTTAIPWSTTLMHAITRLNERELVRQNLIFSSIKKVDDADSTRVMLDAKMATRLGEIAVNVYRATEKPTYRKEPSSASKFSSAVCEISEKALKGQAVSHGISYGVANVVKQQPSRELKHIDGRHAPLAIFRFKYRSREALQQQLIISRSPSPDNAISSASHRTNRELNDANNQVSAQERLADLKREIEQIKSEVKSEEDHPYGRKRAFDATGIQSGGRVQKTSRHRNGTVIVDLTDD